MIKKLLKKTFLYKIYRKIKKRNKLTFKKAENIISYRYEAKFGERINFENPETYCEKMNFNKLYNYSRIKQQLADKIEVRSWVEKTIGKEYLIPLIGTYDSFDDIDFNKLPESYVIKCNHDSGSYVIVDKNHPINMEEAKKRIDNHLKRSLSEINYEMHYRDIVPRVLIEKNLGTEINDYKFFCFGGKVKFFKIDFNRFTDHKANYFDTKLKLLPFGEKLYPPDFNAKIPIPKNIKDMIRIAEKLSASFDHVRVDLYDVGGKIYFGEMTFTAGNGMSPFAPKKYEKIIGGYWNLDTSRRRKLLNKKLIVKRVK